MNRTISYIKAQRQRLAALDKMVNDGECFAAGISVEITVGANGEREPLKLEFGVYSDMKGILSAMRQGIVDSIDQNLKNARRELDELSTFLDQGSF